MNKCKTCGADCKRDFCSISCSNKYWNPITKERRIKVLKKADEIITFQGICQKCGASFSVTRERKKLIGKNIPKCCSRQCANSRIHSTETVNKIKQSLRAKYPTKERIEHEVRISKIKVDRFCEECRSLISGRNAKRFCSLKCATENAHRIHEETMIASLLSGDNIVRVNHKTIKSAVIKIKGHQCSICKNTEWMGGPIPLILDHIDGRANNNVLDNLRLVCGCCDMLLPTYKSKNKNSDRKFRKKHQ